MFLADFCEKFCRRLCPCKPGCLVARVAPYAVTRFHPVTSGVTHRSSL